MTGRGLAGSVVGSTSASSRRCLAVVVLVLSFLAPLSSARAESSAAGGTIPNFSEVEPWLYRGGRPEPDGIKALAARGIRTIVSLERGWFEKESSETKEERRLAEKGGLRFIHVPLHPFFKPGSEDLRRVLSIVLDPACHPVLVHCRKGSDRTGIIIAGFRIRHQGWTVDQAYEEMKSFGHKSVRLFWWKDVLRDIICDPRKRSGRCRRIGDTFGASCRKPTVMVGEGGWHHLRCEGITETG
jgi:tyrosine-protein phosphatase SIW14